MKVAVVGLGKVGLPLAAQFARNGWSVVGCDINPMVVAAVSAGRSHIVEEPGLGEGIAEGVAAGRLSATVDTASAVAASEVTVVIVPLGLDPHSNADFRALDSAVARVGAGLRSGGLVIIETTVPVGTTRGRMAALLERESDLRAGNDFFLAFSPERVYSGRILQDFTRYPKIVGGIDQASSERAADFYRSALRAEVIQVANAETAEFSKLAETTYRDVNIALANQLAIYASGRKVDTEEAFRVANTQPFSHIHQPSIGVGGHCIPVYPRFLLQDRGPGELELVSIARETNDGMARVAAELLQDELGGLAGKTVLVLGLAYRENVKELAFTAAAPLIRILRDAGARVLAHDPLFSPAEVAHLGAEAHALEGLTVDAVVIQAFHRAYERIDWKSFKGLRVVLDGRGGLDPASLAGTSALYLTIGSPRRHKPVRLLPDKATVS